MNGLGEHLKLSVRLHFRNTLALIYGYLFPLIFLVAFWVLYRHEKVPLLRHMGELLTVSVLGGACFGLPTSMVSERERGVWRRYRLTPLPTWAFVVSTAVARYLIVLSAGLLQLGLALAVGMTLPEHPFGLFVVFTFVAFALIGLGLVIATLADNVPAVQALGQCIFLPMLIIGGVAVQLASLPTWAQQLSAFFPGRYAVEAIQACVTGDGLAAARFSLPALALIGVAGCIAGTKLFRWDSAQRFATRSGKLWLIPVFAAWAAVGVLAEWQARVSARVAAEMAAAIAVAPVSKKSRGSLSRRKMWRSSISACRRITASSRPTPRRMTKRRITPRMSWTTCAASCRPGGPGCGATTCNGCATSSASRPCRMRFRCRSSATCRRSCCSIWKTLIRVISLSKFSRGSCCIRMTARSWTTSRRSAYRVRRAILSSYANGLISTLSSSLSD